MPKALANRLLHTVETEEQALRAITEPEASAAGRTTDAWSRKQELGHLIDSATNNRVRFVVSALEGAYSGATYDGRGWVELGGYAAARWTELTELWALLNRALARVVEHIPDSRLKAECKVGTGDPVSLEFLINDYILHMQHHLDHILAREHVTNYPSADRSSPI